MKIPTGTSNSFHQKIGEVAIKIFQGYTMAIAFGGGNVEKGKSW